MASLVIKALSEDSGSRSGPPKMNSSTSTSRISVAASLCNKFEALENKWSGYNKFGDLEKKWSQFSAATKAKPRIIKIDDLEQKWGQVHAFASKEKMLQQRRISIQRDSMDTQKDDLEGRQDQQSALRPQQVVSQTTQEATMGPREEPRDLAPIDEPTNQTPLALINPLNSLEDRKEDPSRNEVSHEDNTVLTATETSVLTREETIDEKHQEEGREPGEERRDIRDEHQDELELSREEIVIEEEVPDPGRSGFVLKRRGGKKRPRRLLALTKVRSWRLGPSKSKDVQEDEHDEEVYFEAAKEASHYSHHDVDEPGDNLYTDEEISKRVLSSMPNDELWRAYNKSIAQEAGPTGTAWEDTHWEASLLESLGQLKLSSGSPGAVGEQQTGHTLRRTKCLPLQSIAELKPDSDEAHKARTDTFAHALEVWVQEQLSTGCASGLMRVLGSRHETMTEPKVRDLLEMRLRSISAIVIQAWIRAKLIRRSYLRMRAVAAFDTHPHGSRRRRDLLSPRVARIQSVRKFQVVDRYRKCATTIQSAYRRWHNQKQYLLRRTATVTIQRFCRPLIPMWLASSRIQRFQLHSKIQCDTSPHLSFDDTGISTLSFDNSYQFDDQDEEILTIPKHQREPPLYGNDPVPVSSLPPLHPASPTPPKKSAPRSRLLPRPQSLQPCPPQASQCLPPKSPAEPSRSASAGPSHRRAQVQEGLHAIKSLKGHPPRPQSLQPCPPQASQCLPPKSPAEPSRSASAGPSHRRARVQEGLHAIKSLKGHPPSPKNPHAKYRNVGRSSMSSLSPKRRRPATSPLASIVSSPHGERQASSHHRRENKTRPLPISPRRLVLNRSQSPAGKRHLHYRKHGIPDPSECAYQERHEKRIEHVEDNRHAVYLAHQKPLNSSMDEKHAASTSIQKIWRGHRSLLKLVSMLVTQSTIVCDCSNGIISRDRLLRQKAQVLSVRKAISQVGCLGATARLATARSKIHAEWKNILYINGALTNGNPINTFSTIHVRTALKRTKRIDAMSGEKLFTVTIKAVLQQHLLEQQHKASRMSLLERSLSRRRAPMARDAVLRIQKEARSWLCRRAFASVRVSAVAIQKTFRSWQARKPYLLSRQTAIQIQAFFRAELVRGIVFQYWSAAIALRRFWNQPRQARLAEADSLATKIQAISRGRQCRENQLQRCSYALVLQAHTRAFLSRRRFTAMRFVCANLQVLARRKIAQRRQDEEFEQYNNMMWALCATSIASAFRRHRDFYKYRCMRRQALIIQTAARGYLVRHHLSKKLQASIQIQRFFRQRVFQQRISTWSFAATLVSCWYRGARQKLLYAKQRRRLVLSHLCASQIQAQFRKYSVQRNYRQLSKATTRIQANWRCWLQRCTYLYKKLCAITVQSIYRTHRVHKHFQTARSSSAVIQSLWRGHCSRFNFHIHRGATIYLQRTWRQYRLLRERKSDAAVRVQTAARRTYRCRKFRSQKKAVCLLQTWSRKLMVRNAFLKKRAAAIHVQAFLRRLRNEASFSLLRISVTQLQACFRKRSPWKRFVIKRYRVVTVQRVARGFLQRQRFSRIRDAALKIQQIVCLRLRQKNQMAALVQAECRRAFCRLWLSRSRKSAFLIQRHWRMVVARSRYRVLIEKAKISAIRLQNWYRCYITCFKFVIDRFSIVLAQSTWRAHKHRREYLKIRNAILRIQAFYRDVRSKREKVLASERIQCFIRHCISRKRGQSILSQKRKQNKIELVRMRRKEKIKNAHDMESAACALQHVYRKFRKETVTEAALVIQRFRRSILFARKYRRDCMKQMCKRRRYRHRAAICIQRSWRRQLCVKRFVTKKNAGYVIVAVLQALLDGKKSRSHYLKAQLAATLIQSHWRGFLFRSSYGRLCNRLEILRERADHWLTIKSKSATLLQRQWRRSYCLKRYVKRRRASVRFQCQWRSYAARRSYERSLAVSVLQRTWRGTTTRASYKILLSTMTMIEQSRNCLVSKRSMSLRAVAIQRKWRYYLLQRDASTRVQRCWRSFYAWKRENHCASRIQGRYRATRRRRRLQKKVVSATCLQAWFRSKSSRFHFLIKIICASILQSIFRGHLVAVRYKRLKKGIVKIQGLARQKACQHCYDREKICTVRLQNLWRQRRCQQRYSKLRRATIGLQRNIRRKRRQQKGKLAARIQQVWRKHLARILAGAIRLQSNSRRFLTRKRHHIVCRGIIACQATWRKYHAVRANAATTLQRCARMTSYRSRYHKLRSRIVILQALSRRSAVQKKYQRFCATIRCFQIGRKKLYCKKQQARRHLNTFCLMIICRSRFNKLRLATTTVQSQWRRFCSNEGYQKLRHGVVGLQEKWKQYFLLKSRCAICLQSYVRTANSQSALRYKRECTVLVQNQWRAFHQRSSYRKLYDGFTCLQSTARTIHSKKSRSSIVLQAGWRTHKAKKSFNMKKRGCLVLQGKVRVRFALRQKSAFVIQAQWRRWLAQSKYTSLNRQVLAQRDQLLEPVTSRGSPAMKWAIIKVVLSAVVVQHAYTMSVNSYLGRLETDILPKPHTGEDKIADVDAVSLPFADVSDFKTEQSNIVPTTSTPLPATKSIRSIPLPDQLNTQQMPHDMASSPTATRQNSAGATSVTKTQHYLTADSSLQLHSSCSDDEASCEGYGNVPSQPAKRSWDIISGREQIESNALVFTTADDMHTGTLWSFAELVTALLCFVAHGRKAVKKLVKFVHSLSKTNTTLTVSIPADSFGCRLMKLGLALSFFLLAFMAVCVTSPALFVSFSSLSLSLFMADSRTYGIVHQKAAIRIQVFIRKQKSEIAVQRLVRHRQQETKHDKLRPAAVNTQLLQPPVSRSMSENILAKPNQRGCLDSVSTPLLTVFGAFHFIIMMFLGALTLIGSIFIQGSKPKVKEATKPAQPTGEKRPQEVAPVEVPDQRVSTKLQRFKCLVENRRGHINRNNPSMNNSAQVAARELNDEAAAAKRIQLFWRHTLKRIRSATLIQSRFRRFLQRHRYLEIYTAAATIRRYLIHHRLAVKREKATTSVKEALKQVLFHRLHTLSAVVIQRWFRMQSARASYRELKSRRCTEKAGCKTDKEQTEVEYVARRSRFHRDANNQSGATSGSHQIINNHEQRTDRRPFLDRLLMSDETGDSLDTDYSRFSSITDENSYGNRVVCQVQHEQDDTVKITETESGMEIAVQSTDVLYNLQWCGFEVMPSF